MAFALSPWIKFDYSDGNGNPLAGGKVCTYLNGASTKTDTYTDATGAIPNTNPVILDAAGRADIWLDTNVVYKFVIKDANDVVVDTIRDIAVSVNTVVAGVSSFAGRTGAVSPQAGDYTSDLITNDSSVTGDTVTEALDNLAGAIPDVSIYLVKDGSAGPQSVEGPVSFSSAILPADDAVDFGDASGGFRNAYIDGTGWIRRTVSRYVDVRLHDYSPAIHLQYPETSGGYSVGLLSVDGDLSNPPALHIPHQLRTDDIRVAYATRLGLESYLGIREYEETGRYTFTSVLDGVSTQLFSTYVDGDGSRYLVSDPSNPEATKFLRLLANGYVGLSGVNGQPVFLQSGTKTLAVDSQGVKPTLNSGVSASGIVSRDANGALQYGSYSASTFGAEPALGDPAGDGYILASTTDGVRSWFNLFGTANTFTETLSVNTLTGTTEITGAGFNFIRSQSYFDQHSDVTGQNIRYRLTNAAVTTKYSEIIQSRTVWSVGIDTSGVSIGGTQTVLLSVSPTAASIVPALTLSSLAGTGTRLVTSTSAGLLGNATTIAGNYTWSGSATFNGAVTLGAAAADLITVNGRFASHLVPNTSALNIGDITSTDRFWQYGLFRSGVIIAGGSATGGGLSSYVRGDAQNMFQCSIAGKEEWGAGGSSAVDTNLYRSGVGTLKTDGNFIIGGLAGTGTRMVQATSAGLLSALAAGTTSQYLRGDGTWATPAGGSSNLTIATRTGSSSTGASDQYVRYTGSADATETLPAATGTGRVLYLKNNTSYVWTIDGNASETIDGDTSITLALREAVTIVDAATGVWEII